ncbi:STAS domain-containing protein [Falsiroseomonas sp.]|uniref:STAS domain-containing protein n=1 Tax=Falsiroseomonas sp. TaxID=2870721 RepID=UPI003F71768C
MPTTRDPASQDSPSLVLPASLDLTQAEPLCQALRERLQDSALCLEGSAVERVSTPCLQLLAAAHASARARGIPFRLHGASAVLVAAIADLGLSTAIPLEV